MCDGQREPTSPKGSGSPVRDPVAIQAVIRSQYAALRACYDEVLGRDPEAMGEMRTKLAIDTHGEVTSACFERADLDDHEGGECMLEVFRSLRFPTAAGDLTVSYPLRFVPDVALSQLPDGPPEPRGDDHGLKRFLGRRKD